MNSTVSVIGEGEHAWITMKNLPGFFSKKIDGCNFVSIGTNPQSISVDAEIIESIGGYLHFIPTSSNEKQLMNDFKSILDGNTNISHDLELISNRMIDTEYIKIHEIDNSFYSIRDIEHIDICKIDSDKYGKSAVFNIFDAGFRPSILMIRFKLSPDEDTSTQITAGHIQNMGYILLGKYHTTYLYYFVDDCLYDYCKWSEPKHKNPLMIELTLQIKELIAAETRK